MLLRIALSVPAAIAALAICLWLSDDAQMRVAAVVLTALLPVAAIGSARVAFQLQVRNAVTVAIELANGVLWAAAVVLVTVLDGGIVAYAVAFVTVSAATSLAQLWLALRTTPFRLRGSRSRWDTLLRLGVPVGVGGLLTFGYGYIDQVIVFAVAGARRRRPLRGRLPDLRAHTVPARRRDDDAVPDLRRRPGGRPRARPTACSSSPSTPSCCCRCLP